MSHHHCHIIIVTYYVTSSLNTHAHLMGRCMHTEIFSYSHDYTQRPHHDALQGDVLNCVLARVLNHYKRHPLTQPHVVWLWQVPPAPPAPPAPPPSPPAPPRSPSPQAPPPFVRFFERFRDQEQDTDDLCQLVEFSTCAEATRQFAQKMGPRYRSDLRVTIQHCQGLPTDSDCFFGWVDHSNNTLLLCA